MKIFKAVLGVLFVSPAIIITALLLAAIWPVAVVIGLFIAGSYLLSDGV